MANNQEIQSLTHNIEISSKNDPMEQTANIIFSTKEPFLISLLGTTRSGLGLYNKPWKQLHVTILSDGKLAIRIKLAGKPIKVLNIQQVKIKTLLLNYDAIESLNPSFRSDIGLLVKCKKMSGIATYFRCILSSDDLEPFLNALQQVNEKKNIPIKAIMKSPNRKAIKVSTPLSTFDSINLGISSPVRRNNVMSSIMRRAVTHALDKYIIQDNYDRIVSRRGVFKSLPVAFSNDMVHGSWWFAVGSLVCVIQAALVLRNSNSVYIGTDDSTLSPAHYQASWALIFLVGVFFFLGSLAFIRALHFEPPIKPLFKYYHLQSDELLGSWLFLFGTAPILPYCLIYVSATHNLEIYIIAVFIAMLPILGAALFVWASYPTDKDFKPYVLPIARYLCCCCCKQEWLSKHFANDWLAACWIIYYGTVFATIICGIIFLVSLAELKALPIFINGVYTLENALYLVGSAYFVAGSYPDVNAEDDEESGDNGLHDEDDEFENGKDAEASVHEMSGLGDLYS